METKNFEITLYAKDKQVLDVMRVKGISYADVERQVPKEGFFGYANKKNKSFLGIPVSLIVYYDIKEVE